MRDHQGRKAGCMMAERKRLVKLVRDRVAQFIVGRDGTAGEVTYEPLGHDEHVELLRGKLVEEAVEYLQNPSVGELADAYEAVMALAVVDLGIDHQELFSEARSKRLERGGFIEGVGMFVGTTAPARHEGEHADRRTTAERLKQAADEETDPNEKAILRADQFRAEQSERLESKEA